MLKLSKLAAIAAVTLFSAHASADLLIDAFTTAQSVSDASSNVGNTSNGGHWASQVILTQPETTLGVSAGQSIYRNLFADKFGVGGDAGIVSVGISSTTNRLGFSQEADQWGQGRAIWSGVAGGGYTTAILDLTTLSPTSSFNFTYRSDGALQVDLIVTDLNGNKSVASISTTNTHQAFVADSVSLSEFDFSGLTSPFIGSIEIFFNVHSSEATADVDLTFTRVSEVPEPASLALVGLALTAVALRRRRSEATA